MSDRKIADPRPVRRIVAGNDAAGNAAIYEDRDGGEITTDPARPGYASTRIWVTATTPAPVAGVKETLNLPNRMVPPEAGSLCRFVTLPPESWSTGTVTEEKVVDHFAALGAPEASLIGTGAPHPYMQRTATLDYVFVLSGEVTLVLDTGEVQLKEGDTVVQLGAAHAWSNRSDRPCELFISSHDGRR